MNDLVAALSALAGLVIVAEGLNKLERTARSWMGLQSRWHFANLLKVVAWSLLVFGGGGSIAVPLLHLGIAWLQLAYACTVLGFAVLIVRTRIKEG